MSLLAELEKKLEGLVEGFFSRQFKSGVHPLEMAKGLSKELEAAKAASPCGFYAPNNFSIYLGKEDMAAIGEAKTSLALELEGFTRALANGEGYHLLGDAQIEMLQDDSLSLGQMRVIAEPPVLPAQEELLFATPPLKTLLFLVETAAGQSLKVGLDKERATIGRLAGCDIRLDDPNVSRLHAEIILSKASYIIKDLGSTNGTLLNGRPIDLAPLKDGDVITIGRNRLELSLIDV